MQSFNNPKFCNSSMAKTLNYRSDKPSFWLLHCFGWLGYAVIFTLDNVLFTHMQDVSLMVIFPLLISASIAALITLPLRYQFRRCWNLSPSRLIVVVIVSSMLGAMIWTPLKNLVMRFSKMSKVDFANYVSLDSVQTLWALLDGLSYSFFMMMVWTTLYFGINYHFRLIDEKQLHLDAARLSHNAQIKMLRYQINPHFLFNTLNAISTLVLLGNKKTANTMLVRLSTFLRFSLDNDPEKKVPLCDEIKASMLYLEIEKTRFDERLEVVLEIEELAETLLVPSLILQPLIENSIKHAIANMTANGKIIIKAQCHRQMLVLSVTDNGPALEQSQTHIQHTGNMTKTHSGVGIRNIKDRLEVLYPKNHRFSTHRPQTGGFSVNIEIPMEKA